SLQYMAFTHRGRESLSPPAPRQSITKRRSPEKKNLQNNSQCPTDNPQAKCVQELWILEVLEKRSRFLSPFGVVPPKNAQTLKLGFCPPPHLCAASIFVYHGRRR
ncbi:MAG: hypothetical protein ACK55Z_06230, partial [bacterium]